MVSSIHASSRFLRNDGLSLVLCPFQTEPEQFEVPGAVPTEAPEQSFCSRYFCEGQAVAFSAQKDEQEEQTFFQKHRKTFAMAVPAGLVHIFWWTYMAETSSFDLFTGKSGAYQASAPHHRTSACGAARRRFSSVCLTLLPRHPRRSLAGI